jgi:hypothetical protein
MSHRKTDLGIPSREKSAKAVVASVVKTAVNLLHAPDVSVTDAERSQLLVLNNPRKIITLLP